MRKLSEAPLVRTFLRILLATLPLCSVAVPGEGHANGEVTFTKVLDSKTQVPGGLGPVGPFLDLIDDGPGRRRLYGSPHIAMDDEGNMAFFGGGRIFSILRNQLHSVSRIDGDVRHIAIDQGRVTFGVLDLGGQRIGGILHWEPGTEPFEVAGARTFVPRGGSCVFWTKENGVSYYPFSVDGDAVLFTGTSNERAYADGQAFDCDDLRGNFLWHQGVIERVGGFTRELNPLRASLDDGLLAYIDDDGAIHAKALGGAAVRLAGPGDPIPGRSEVLAFVGAPAVASGRIAFGGRDTAGQVGLYLWERGTLSAVAEQGMALPDGRQLERLSRTLLGDDRFAIFGIDAQGAFLYLASLDGGWERVIDGTNVGFLASDLGEIAGDFDGRQLVLEGKAIYVVRPDGSLLEILRRGGSLDGRRVSVFRAGDLRGNRLALGIGFEGDSVDHLYIAKLPPLPVEIDVKPHRTRNRLHPRSRVSIPVAILGSETFPVEEMDAASVRIGPAAAPARGRPRLRDANGDGWVDLILRFRPRETGLGTGDSDLCLSGETHDSVAFEGCDIVATRR